jgi:hypothetical protein
MWGSVRAGNDNFDMQVFAVLYDGVYVAAGHRVPR